MGSGLAMAGATLTAQYAGAGRQDMVNHVAGQTMIMVVITSFVLGALGYIVAPYLLTLLGVAPDVYDGALGFMRVSFVGMIFVFAYAMFQALMRGIGQTRIPLLIVLGTVILNFLLRSALHLRLGADAGLGRDGRGARDAGDASARHGARHGDLSARASRHPSVVARPHPRSALYQARFPAGLSGLGRILDPRARLDGDVVPGRQLRHA